MVHGARFPVWIILAPIYNQRTHIRKAYAAIFTTKYPAASSGVFRSPEELVSGLIPNVPKNEQFDSRPKGRGIKPSPRINLSHKSSFFSGIS